MSAERSSSGGLGGPRPPSPPRAAGLIRVRGAREHNLKNIDVDIPRDKLVVITGLSGSGKSSLAFDTIFAEGQRRYVESLSAYARQFLGQLEKPNVDHVEGLSPAISIDQKSASHNPRSTVGTVTEIYDYLRVLYANLGEPHCPKCGARVARQSAEEIVLRVLQMPAGTKLQIIAPVVRERKGEYRGLLKELQKDGYVRVRVDGKEGTVDDAWDLKKYEKHTVEVIVDRLAIDAGERSRLQDAVETALKLGKGLVTVWTPDGETNFSEAFACPDCGVSLPELAPRSFSFNNPFGACETCKGLGTKLEIDGERVIAYPDRRLQDGPFHPAVVGTGPWIYKIFENLAKEYKFKMTDRWQDLPKTAQKALLHGSREFFQVYKSKSKDSDFHWEGYDSWEGIVPRLERLFTETESEGVRQKISALMSNKPCPACEGRRLRPESLAVTIRGSNLAQVADLPVDRLVTWFDEYETSLDDRERAIAGEVIKEIRARLGFMRDVGLEYLTLARTATTLSGGEAQRIRLATQIGSGLVGVLYVLDEPSIGLHARDEQRLIRSLKGLRDLGNTLIIVEHDRAMMEAADWIIDLGPGAGEHGGRIVAQGTPAQVAKVKKGSWTGQYLGGTFDIAIPEKRRPGNGKTLVVRNARQHNLKGVDVTIPLSTLVCVTGVSGSGKSTVVHDVLYKQLARDLYGAADQAGAHDRIEGLANIDKVVLIDQSPIGRTPRSNPATYTGLFTPIRELFAETKDAKVRGYQPGRFSFNVKGGRCEACEGDGVKQIEMHFMADVFVPCEVCKGARYNAETLAVKYKGKSIRDVLDMSVEEAAAFFENIPRLHRILRTLADVGLGYVRLGQPAPTLSGGEAQRVKLATELHKRATGNTLYILDEPTTGLHAVDVSGLLDVLQRLVEPGNTVLVIEHNLDVVKTADHIIDLGPEGGDAGGRVVAQGTPEEVADTKTYTGAALREALARHGSAAKPSLRSGKKGS